MPGVVEVSGSPPEPLPNEPRSPSVVETEVRLLRQAFQEQGKVIGALDRLTQRISDHQFENEKRVNRRFEEAAALQTQLTAVAEAQVKLKDALAERLAELAAVAEAEKATKQAVHDRLAFLATLGEAHLSAEDSIKERLAFLADLQQRHIDFEERITKLVTALTSDVAFIKETLNAPH